MRMRFLRYPALVLLGILLLQAAIAQTGTASQKKRRAVLAVVSVSALSEDGRANVTNVNQQANALLFSKAEEAVTKSNACRLVGRDQWKERSKEIKFTQEGFVEPESAKEFGHDQGVDKLLVVFVSGGSVRDYTEKVSGDGPSLTDLFSSKKKPAPAKNVRMIEANTTITCRYTSVDNSDRTTVSYKGEAVGRLDQTTRQAVMEDALNDAFDKLRADLWNNRQLFTAGVVQAKDEFVRIDLGSKDGIVKDVLFDLYTLKDEGDGFVDRKHFGGDNIVGRVMEVNETNAKMELGEWKKKGGGLFGGGDRKEWVRHDELMKQIVQMRSETDPKKAVTFEAVEKK